jgi:hypothetical protein
MSRRGRRRRAGCRADLRAGARASPWPRRPSTTPCPSPSARGGTSSRRASGVAPFSSRHHVFRPRPSRCSAASPRRARGNERCPKRQPPSPSIHAKPAGGGLSGDLVAQPGAAAQPTGLTPPLHQRTPNDSQTPITEGLISCRNILLGNRTNENVLTCLQSILANLDSITILSTRNIVGRCTADAVAQVRDANFVGVSASES